MDSRDIENLSEAYQQVYEATLSAKAARAGKDIGKPGKQFAKIAKEAGERYGSKERGEKVAGAVLAKMRAKAAHEEVDLYDVILSHLLDEGYASTEEAATAIMANMSEEWKDSIVEETKRTEYLQKKFNKENQRKSGSAHTAIPGKQNTGQALYKARQSERHMRGEN